MNDAEAIRNLVGMVSCDDRGMWECRGCGREQRWGTVPPYCRDCDPTGERKAADRRAAYAHFDLERD